MKNNRKGFTLIELLVVVLIIGILASIAIPQYFKVVERSKITEVMSAISSLKSAQERYMARATVYSDTLERLDITFANSAASTVNLKKFVCTLGAAGSSWSLSCLRQPSVTTKYGAYTVDVAVPGVAPDFASPVCHGGNDEFNCNIDLISTD